MRTRRQPSEHFLRRLQGDGKPVSPSVAEPAALSIPPLYKHFGRYFFRGLEVLGVVAALLFLIPTACVMIIDLKDRQTQRVVQAWQLVTQKAPGNSGKIRALSYLNSEDCVLSDDPTKWELINLCGFTALFRSPKQRESLSGLDLSSEPYAPRVYLEDLELSGAYLRGTNLSRADLRRADLSVAYLKDANLSGAYLVDANLSGAHLWDANLSGAYLWDANLLGARLVRADLSGAYLMFADLSLVALWSADLSGAYLTEADLTGASLSSADLSGAYLRGADLTGASLSSADLSGAYLRGADLSGAYLRGADLSRADLRGANLSGADLTDANLSGASFSGVTLSAAAPYTYPLTREMLMGGSYNAFSWPMDAPSGGAYLEVDPPKIDSSLLVHFTAVGDDCTWINGLRHVECTSVFYSPLHEWMKAKATYDPEFTHRPDLANLLFYGR